MAGSAALSVLTLRRWTLLAAAFAYDFVQGYSYWSDFFKSNDVLVSVSQYDFTRPYPAKNQALAELGGVSASFQYSNLDFSSVELSMSADVLFVFGPHGRDAFESNGSTCNTIVETGYITDHSFEPARESSAELRGRLEDAGASYVVAYFDEGSSDSRMSPISNADTGATYESFLDWVREDDTLGLILKPKAPATLRDRVGPEACAKLDEAVSTGRCVVLGADSDVRTSSSYPVEAALAADLAVGMLLSGTAALESHLAGVPTVFLDPHGLPGNAAYENGGEGVSVFRSPSDVRAAVARTRAVPGAISGFGDLRRWSTARTVFDDGRAAERMGGYVRSLYEKLGAGATREEALRDSAREYVAAWGDGRVHRTPSLELAGTEPSRERTAERAN